MSQIYSIIEARNDINYSDKLNKERALLLHKILQTSTFNTIKGDYYHRFRYKK
jgi:hypothetical protein